MTLFEELQQIENEIIDTMRSLQTSSREANERLALIFILQDLTAKRNDLRTIASYYDP